jgi:hypothetical protein
MTKREFLAAGLGASLSLVAARAQTSPKRSGAVRYAKTTRLFKSPGGFPNGLCAAPEGLWIAEQKLTGAQAAAYKTPEPKTLTENAWLVDWTGKVLNTITTPSRNTSGMAVGGGYVWMVANAPPEGVFQVDMNSRLVSHRQIPLGPANDGGGCHGALWQDGKLWIASLRLRGNLRVDPVTWQPEFIIPFYQAPDRNRYHDIAWDNGSIWQVVGNDCTRYSEYHPCLVRYEAATGKALETVDFLPGSCDPHGLTMHDGKLIGCDAGIHPNWPNMDSPTAGWIFQIDFV